MSGVTGYRGCPRTGVSPTSGATPAKIATGGSNAPTCVHGASSGFRSESPKGFAFTYFVVAVTAGGDGFPAKMSVSPW